MLHALTVLAYLVTHDHAHSDHLLRLSVTQAPHSLLLRWGNVPAETHSLALIVKDMSGNPRKYHSVLYNLPGRNSALILKKHPHFNPHVIGLNSWGKQEYHEPKHAIEIDIYALDKRFSSQYVMNGQLLESKIQGHLIAKGTKVVVPG